MTTTTTIEYFLRELRASGIRVVLRDERVHVSAPSGALTDEMRQQLSERRDEALAYLLAARSRAQDTTRPVSVAQETTICPSSPATFVPEVETLSHALTGSPLVLEVATTGPNPQQDQVVAIALNLAGRVTILDLRHYSLLPTSEQAAWRGALQRLFQPGWCTWVGQNLARSWLFLLHHFGVRLGPVYDPLLVELVLSGQDPGRVRPRTFAEIAACYQSVLPRPRTCTTGTAWRSICLVCRTEPASCGVGRSLAREPGEGADADLPCTRSPCSAARGGPATSVSGRSGANRKRLSAGARRPGGPRKAT